MSYPIKKKKKKVIYTSLRYVLLIILSLLVFQGTRQAYFFMHAWLHKAFALEPVNVIFSDFYNPKLANQVTLRIKELMANANFLFFNKAAFYISLRKDFSIIEKVLIERAMLKGCNVHVVGVKPVCLLSTQQVLAENKCLYDAADFVQWQASCCCKITKPMGLQDMESLYVFAKAFTPQVAADYEMTYVDGHCAELRALHNEKSYSTTVLVSQESLARLTTTFASVETILKDLEARGILKQSKRIKKKKQLVLDTRFDKRVIVKFVGESQLGRLG